MSNVTSSWTPAQLVALEAAIAKGVRVVMYGDQRVEYQSVDAMIRVRDLMRSEIANAGVVGSQSRVIYAGRRP